MRITFAGAAEGVTGSCALVETGDMRVLVDCGMFQGDDEAPRANRQFPFNPSKIDAVLLTHAHLDHCGRLPLLHAEGFRGPVYATPPTCDIAPLILLDAARLQQEDAERRNRRERRAGQPITRALYDEQDVVHLMRYVQSHPYEAPLRLGNGLTVSFRQSGHILGSASILIEADGARALFSGDLGGPGRNVVPDPAAPPACDLVVCESTYGDRNHRPESESVAELREAILWAHREGGNVVIPSFALERTQDVLFHLRALREAGEIPEGPVYLDSPLAANITRIYEQHYDDLDENTKAVLAKHEDPFRFPGLSVTTSTEQSRGINGKQRVIIIAGSGMCNGGRVVHHLKHNLWRKDSAVVFTGFQARGTLGRRIIERPYDVMIDREPIAVAAKLFTINGFSAHADQQALLGWLGQTGAARILLNHGEPSASETLAGLLRAQGRTADVVKPDTRYEVAPVLAKA